MNNGDAYKLLAARLERLRREEYNTLLSRVGQPPTSESLRLNNEDLVVEVQVLWADKRRRTLRVAATALGPSTWLTQRLTESFVIAPNQPSAE